MDNLSMRGQPGIGDHFMKWVHDNRFCLPEGNRVPITKEGDSYKEFPESGDLADFDPPDRMKGAFQEVLQNNRLCCEICKIPKKYFISRQIILSKRRFNYR
jgi:hypothetical protein